MDREEKITGQLFIQLWALMILGPWTAIGWIVRLIAG